MSAPLEGFARCGWLDDPVARDAGRAVVALVLALAARAAERGTPGELSSAEWVYHLDPREADRALRAGLVHREELGGGAFVLRLSAWVLAQVDTNRSIRRRELTRDRVRRFRARPRQLDLFEDGESEAIPTAAQVVPVARLRCAKPVRANVDVTVDVTQSVEKSPRTLYPRAGAPAVRTSEDQEEQLTRSVVAREQKQWTTPDDRRGLRLLMAIVANASGDAIERRRLRDDERRALLDRVRTTCARAHLALPPDAMIDTAVALLRKYGRRSASA